MTDDTNLEAAVFRRLLTHLQHRTDVQNIDLMGYGGFCRNCFYKWYMDAAAEAGNPITKQEAQMKIYGMSYEEYKEKHQTPASPEQLNRMNESVKKNNH